MDVLHVRIVYPEDEQKNEARPSHRARVFVTFPDGEERELLGVRTVMIRLGIDHPDQIQFDLYSTVEVQYGN